MNELIDFGPSKEFLFVSIHNNINHSIICQNFNYNDSRLSYLLFPGL